jgi:hypothetical protein
VFAFSLCDNLSSFASDFLKKINFIFIECNYFFNRSNSRLISNSKFAQKLFSTIFHENILVLKHIMPAKRKKAAAKKPAKRKAAPKRKKAAKKPAKRKAAPKRKASRKKK